ncbi:MAG: MFS transporter [Phycisphaerae bacterium]|nr:MFS transporter [Phycisphaerae bacterium]
MPAAATPADHPLHRMIARLVLLRPGEGAPLLLSGGYFFLVLFSYYLLRPIRDTFGIRGDLKDLPLLWTGTSVAMLAATPVFALLVSRLPRRRFIPLTYRFFALNIVLFYGALMVLPDAAHTALGYAFYIWLSVFNLFAISVFWGYMADLFRPEQGARLFAAIAVGGTLGAMAGSLVPALIAERIGALHLMPLSALTLELAVWCVLALASRFHVGAPATPGSVIRGEPTRRVWSGFVLIARSRYLQFLCLYMLLFTLTTTFLTFEQLRVVKSAFESSDARTAAFARMDLAANGLALVTQLFITGRFVRRLGIGAALLLLPVLTLLGFMALWIGPALGWPMLGVFAAFYVSRRGLHFAVDRPAREMLYTPLGPDEKYKSKSFIDTFVYRGGDLMGAWMQAIGAVAANAAPIAMGICAVWMSIAGGLALTNRRIAACREGAGSAGSA